MTESSFYKQNTMPDLITGEPEPPLPEKIGPYKIESLFSKGGMSFLYLGIDPQGHRPVVIKVLSPSYINSPQAVEQFLKEAQVIALSNHPNIVKLYNQGKWEKGLYIAMELVRGISLKQFIIQQSLSLRRALEIILQVAYALHHLHSHGVIHRDLKPENILITEEGEIKVIDFGIAQLHEEKNATTTAAPFVGTPNYMSPEQKENPTSVTFASDIYSLGIILYELILGKLSYGLITLAGLPKKLKSIVAKALAVSVGQRYQNITDFIQDISHYLQSGSLEKEKPGTDQVKEIQETIQKATLNLLPPLLPDWPQIDLGLAKPKGPQQPGVYYDFFHLPNHCFLILLATTPTTTLASSIPIALLRGMIQCHLRMNVLNTEKPFSLVPWITTLNQLLAEEGSCEPFCCSFILLNPLEDTLGFLSCGLPGVLHLAEGQMTARTLESRNPLLGSIASHTFSAATDNWQSGDTLIAHSLCIPEQNGSHQQEALELCLQEVLSEAKLLSAQRQAESLLKAASLAPAYSLVPSAKMVVSIQRTG